MTIIIQKSLKVYTNFAEMSQMITDEILTNLDVNQS